MIERQELYCHACGRIVLFELDMELEGAHVLNCPNCGHEHCRVVRGGRITEDRWDQRNQPRFTVTNVTMSSSTSGSGTLYTVYADSSTTGQSSTLLWQSWLNVGI